MTEQPFPNHRSAALALLNDRTTLSHKEAGFLGHVTVALALSDKQADWLNKLQAKHGLLPFRKGDQP